MSLVSPLESLELVQQEFIDKATEEYTSMQESMSDEEFAPHAARYTGYSAAATAVGVQMQAMRIQLQEIERNQEQQSRIIT